MSAMSGLREITKEELAKHNTRTDCWMAINGKVYDVTDYIKNHPGGIGVLMQGAGKDATDMFNNAYSSKRFRKAHTYVDPESYLRGKQIVGILKK